MNWSPVYSVDDSSGVRMRASAEVGYDYSDGADAEAYMLDSVLACSDVSSGSDELVARIRDWPSEYHFSASRATLLAPFDFSGLTVLEVGCGCGALTRALGEMGARVVALEGSLQRARITAARCRELENVEVVCDDFRVFEPPTAFDAVLLIGVLEYAPCYFTTDDPTGAALAKARACLTDSGALVVALENQLGLKYFAGCTEDHHGQAFFGIEDRYNETAGPRTFGRDDLRHRLSNAGFANHAWYYPFPDYKLPRLILTESGLTDPRLPSGIMIGGLRSRDYAWPHPEVFAEDAAWDVVAENGLVGELANSFLVVCSPSRHCRLLNSPGWLAEMRTTDRVRAYRTHTQFVPDGDELRVVKTRACHGAAEPCDSPVSLSLPSDSPLLPGVPLGRRVRRLLQAPGTDAGLLADVLRPWIDLLRGATLNSQASMLPGGHLDLVPWNVMEPHGVPLRAIAQTGLTPFDLEWEYRPPLRLEHVVYRGLVSPLLAARGRSYLNRDATIAELISDLSRRLGAPIDAALLPDLVGREAAIQSVVFGMDQQQVLEKMTAQLSEPSAANTALEIALGVRDARIHDLMLMVAERDARLTQLARERDAAQEQIRAVENSTSWKLTAPLRRCGRS